MNDQQWEEFKRIIAGLPKEVWDTRIGRTGPDNEEGRAGDILSITASRAKKGAQRSGAALAEIQNTEPGKITRAQIDALAAELSATLPPAFIKALATKLSK